jgi:hypothetical protein
MKTSLETLQRVRKNIEYQEALTKKLLKLKEKDIKLDYILQLFEWDGVHYYKDRLGLNISRKFEGKEVPRMRICPEVLGEKDSPQQKKYSTIDPQKYFTKTCLSDCAFYPVCIGDSSANKKYLICLRAAKCLLEGRNIDKPILDNFILFFGKQPSNLKIILGETLPLYNEVFDVIDKAIKKLGD